MNVQILTTQNVAIEYQVAGFGNRAVAAFIDALLLIGYIFLLLIILSALAGMDNSPTFVSDENLLIVLIIILQLPWFLYPFLCETFMDGQTFGKKVMKIRVVRDDGGEPSVGNYAIRWLLGLFEITLTLGVPAAVIILMSERGQRLGDMAAGTLVVSLRPAATLKDTIYAQVLSDYEPVFSTVNRLSDSDVTVIKEVLNSCDNRANPIILRALTHRVLGVLDVETDLPQIEFLQTVVKDYNHVTSR